MKYNDNGEYKDIYVKAFDTLPIGTEVDYDGETVPAGWTEVSDIDIGTITYGFGDMMSADNSTYAVHLYGGWTATKISSTIWKFDIQGIFNVSNPPSNYYNWGFDVSKISTMLNNKVGVEVATDTHLAVRSSWALYNTSGALEIERVNYGTVLSYENGYLIPARYYTTSGDIGGWGLNRFTNNYFMTATIYLKEV